MTLEEELLFYRNELTGHLTNMFYIRSAATKLMSATVILPHEIRDTIGSHTNLDSSWAEEERVAVLTEWYDHAPQLPIFDAEGLTLTLLSDETVDGYYSDSKNAGHHIREIMRISKPFDVLFAKNGGSVSFAGFTNEEVHEIVTATRTRAEGLLEKVRDIHTHVCHYIPKTRLGIHDALRPDLSAIRIGDPQPKRRNPIVFCPAWWEQATGPDMANHIMEQLAIIKKFSAPPSNHPPVITYFGSHVSNHLKYLNLVG